MTENNEPSKSRARTTAPEGSIDTHEYIDGKNFVPEPNIKTEVGQKGVICTPETFQPSMSRTMETV